MFLFAFIGGFEFLTRRLYRFEGFRVQRKPSSVPVCEVCGPLHEEAPHLRGRDPAAGEGAPQTLKVLNPYINLKPVFAKPRARAPKGAQTSFLAEDALHLHAGLG